ncbi:UNVERIFIED_CONTAM: hypothetical protein RCG69_18985, partial [Kocuria sp. CPCC 205293]
PFMAVDRERLLPVNSCMYVVADREVLLPANCLIWLSTGRDSSGLSLDCLILLLSGRYFLAWRAVDKNLLEVSVRWWER